MSHAKTWLLIGVVMAVIYGFAFAMEAVFGR